MSWNLLQRPINDPILVFFLLLVIILIVPPFFRKIKIPSLVGLIIAGIIIGPHGYNLVSSDNSIQILGQAGLLYIMFLAGLDLDMVRIKTAWLPGLVFGLLTFLIPLFSGLLVCRYILHLNLTASVLVSSMFSTHTLVSYPIAARFGITKNMAVTLAIAGTIITDTLVLLLFSVLASLTGYEANYTFWLRLTVGSFISLLVIFLVIPKVARWFFRHTESERVLHFVFVLAIVYFSAILAKISGFEAIIGAFLAGIVFNRIIPPGSALMGRVEFFGNALFIPIFLVSTGMLVNPGIITENYLTVFFATVLTIHALFSKWLAAWITQKITGLSALQGRVLFGLSSSHAAATLAIIIIGYNLQMISAEILNATLILIMITCMFSAFVTETAGRKLARTVKNVDVLSQPQSRLMVTLSNPQNAVRLIELAMILQKPKPNQPIISLAIVNDLENSEQKVSESRNFLESYRNMVTARDFEYLYTVRIDMNTADGIVRAAREMAISDVIVGWPNRIHYQLFGDLYQKLLEGLNQSVIFARLMVPLHSCEKVIFVVPPEVESEPGFYAMIDKIIRYISGKTVLFISTKQTYTYLSHNKQKNFVAAIRKVMNYSEISEIESIIGSVNGSEMVLIFNTRRENIIYNKDYYMWVETYSKKISENIIMVFPPKNQGFNAHNLISPDEFEDFNFGLGYRKFSILTKRFFKSIKPR